MIKLPNAILATDAPVQVQSEVRPGAVFKLLKTELDDFPSMRVDERDQRQFCSARPTVNAREKDRAKSDAPSGLFGIRSRLEGRDK